MRIFCRPFLVLLVVLPFFFHILYWAFGWGELVLPQTSSQSGHDLQGVLDAMTPAVTFGDLPILALPYIVLAPFLALAVWNELRRDRLIAARLLMAAMIAMAATSLIVLETWRRHGVPNDTTPVGMEFTGPVLAAWVYMAANFSRAWLLIGGGLQAFLLSLTWTRAPRLLLLTCAVVIFIFWLLFGFMLSGFFYEGF